MSIEYHQETRSWEANNLTEEERESLVEIAKNLIIDHLGQELADRIMQVAYQRGVRQSVDLDEIPQEEMGNA